MPPPPPPSSNDHTPPPPPPPAIDLPPEVAAEIAAYLRSSLFAPLATNIERLRDECESEMEEQKDRLQDAQSQISNMIEPVAAELVPIAEDLEDVYAQIDLLEVLLARSGENIRAMATKVERTEAAVRRETRALDDAKPLPMWKEYEPIGNNFRAADYVEGGRLKKPLNSPQGRLGTSVSRPGTPRTVG